MNDAQPVPVEAKPAVRSWTIIFNVVAGVVAVAVALQGAALPLPAWAAGALTSAVIIGNLILRFRTVQPVTLSLTAQVGEAPAPPWTPTVTGPPRGLRQ